MSCESSWCTAINGNLQSNRYKSVDCKFLHNLPSLSNELKHLPSLSTLYK